MRLLNAAFGNVNAMISVIALNFFCLVVMAIVGVQVLIYKKI